MFNNAKWITAPVDCDKLCPLFEKDFSCGKTVKKAEVAVSAVGLYKFYINGEQYSFGKFNPGWTNYQKRIQYQTYDITGSIKESNRIGIIGAGGWATANLLLEGEHFFSDKVCVIAELTILFEDGSSCSVVTDDSWDVYNSHILYSHIYNGEIIDNTAEKKLMGKAALADIKSELIPQAGVKIVERERVAASAYSVSPEGDRIIDFGQNLSGHVEIRVNGKRGDHIKIRHAEVLDENGNFYVKNLRTAKQTMEYTLGQDGESILKPEFTTQGFRYIAIDEYPANEIDIKNFTAVAVYANMKRTGRFSCGNDIINKLYDCILWTERSNFMEVPTDCPQRDERLGWLGDAELFCKAAAYNYDVYQFFAKWLKDVASQQLPDGAIRAICPYNDVYDFRYSAAWSDAVVIIPFELYKIYGDKAILEDQFDCMKGWVDYMHSAGNEEFLWLGGNHYGDWLALDGPNPREPLTDKNFIGSAFFAHSTEMLIKCGHIIGKDVSEYEKLLVNVRRKFRETYIKDGLPTTDTMTGCIMLLHFGLAEESEKPKIMEHLLELMNKFNNTLCTGLIGTTYILHVLSENGQTKKAFDLLLQKEYPSWIGMMDYGATTIWERFDTIDQNGIKDVRNASLNHYVFGAVYDWLVEGAAGLKPDIDEPGYAKITWKPMIDERFEHVDYEFDSVNGTIRCAWKVFKNEVRFDLSLPENVKADIILPNGFKSNVTGGENHFVALLSDCK